jgi:hypothetical protein
MPRGHGLLRRPVNDRSWRDLTVKTGANKGQVLLRVVRFLPFVSEHAEAGEV